MLEHLAKYSWLVGIIVIFCFCLKPEAIKEILYIGACLTPVFFIALYIEHKKNKDVQDNIFSHDVELRTFILSVKGKFDMNAMQIIFYGLLANIILLLVYHFFFF